MKLVYDTKTGTLLSAVNLMIGDINPYEYTTDEQRIQEIVSQNRSLLQDEHATDKFSEPGEEHPVWVCYITDNYGNPLVVKVVSTATQAQTWLDKEPLGIGKKDDETRGNRFVERFDLDQDFQFPTNNRKEQL